MKGTTKRQRLGYYKEARNLMWKHIHTTNYFEKLFCDFRQKPDEMAVLWNEERCLAMAFVLCQYTKHRC